VSQGELWIVVAVAFAVAVVAIYIMEVTR